jgi:hypothetical protein
VLTENVEHNLERRSIDASRNHDARGAQLDRQRRSGWLNLVSALAHPVA